jgi:haloalkane dehalogenase
VRIYKGNNGASSEAERKFRRVKGYRELEGLHRRLNPNCTCQLCQVHRARTLPLTPQEQVAERAVSRELPQSTTPGTTSATRELDDMTISAKSYAKKKFLEIRGSRMAYIDEGEGDAIVFQHGNPTSSYLWRNVMPHCEGLGRLVACDMIGMGDSDKLSPSGPERYSYAEQREYLFALWDALNLGDRIIFVVHDWGSALGFEWARHHHERVQGLAYMESIVQPFSSQAASSRDSEAFQALRSHAGEQMILQDNVFIERRLPAGILRTLSDEETAAYRKPFLKPGEDRRPMLSWPRQIPIGGQPADVAAAIEDYAAWLQQSNISKLFINAEPGILLTGSAREFCRTWPNQTEVTVKGLHFIQEDSPSEIGQTLAEFVRSLR